MFKNSTMSIILQLGRREALAAFPTHFQLWETLKFSNCDTFWSTSSCFPSKFMLNKPPVLHRKQCTWARTHCSGSLHPNPNPLCCLNLPYSSTSHPKGQVLVLCDAKQQLLLLEENWFSLPGCLAIHTATLFAALCESEVKDITET